MPEKTATPPSAKYKLTIKSNTGFSGEQSGTVTPEQYGAACHVLGGHVAPTIVLAANDLLTTLKSMVSMMDNGDEYGAGSPWHKQAVIAISLAEGGGA